MSLLIQVKDACGTYNASAPGHKQKASCTSGRKQAAIALAVKIFDVPHANVTVEKTGPNTDGCQWYQAEKLDWEAQ